MEDYDNLYDDSSLKLAATDETANESTDLYGDIVGSSALNDSRDQGLWNGLNESAPAAARAPSQDPSEQKPSQQYYPQQQAYSHSQYPAQSSQPPAQQQTQRRPVHFEPPALDTRPTRVQSVVNFEGLEWWVTDRDLLGACERYGRVKHVKIALEKENGKSKGWALVEFVTPEEANECVKSMNGVVFPRESFTVSAKIVDSSRLQLVLTEFHPFQVNHSRNDHRNTGRSGGPPPYQQRRRDPPHSNVPHGHGMNPNMMNNQMGQMMVPMMMGPMSGMNQMGGFMAPGMGMMNGGQMMPMMNMPGGQMMMPRGSVMPNMMPAGPPQGGQPMHPMGHQSAEPPRDSGDRRRRTRSRSRSPRGGSHKDRDVKDSKDKEKSREREKERSRSKERRRESGSRRDDRDRRDRR